MQRAVKSFRGCYMIIGKSRLPLSIDWDGLSSRQAGAGAAGTTFVLLVFVYF